MHERRLDECCKAGAVVFVVATRKQWIPGIGVAPMPT
jgi:hypothetical protein